MNNIIWPTALLQNENRTASDGQASCMIFLSDVIFLKGVFLVFFQHFLWTRVDGRDKGKWTATYIKVNRITFFCFTIFFALPWSAQVKIITLKNEPRLRTKCTACVLTRTKHTACVFDGINWVLKHTKHTMHFIELTEFWNTQAHRALFRSGTLRLGNRSAFFFSSKCNFLLFALHTHRIRYTLKNALKMYKLSYGTGINCSLPTEAHDLFWEAHDR